MIARLLPAADFAIDTGADEARSDRRAEKHVIDAQPGVALIGISEVIPKGVDTLAWMQLTHRIGPSLSDEARESVPHFGPEERIIEPAFRLIDVKVSRHNVVVAGKNDGRSCNEQRLSMCRQTLEPAKFIIKFRAGRWIAIGKIKAAHQHALDQRLDVAAL